jgi:hypothetical protein
MQNRLNRISGVVGDVYQNASSSFDKALGNNNSLIRKALSPFYLDPDKTYGKNAEFAKTARMGIFAVNGAGIVASHTWFFRSSISHSPKNPLKFSPELNMSQKSIEAANAKQLEGIGGNKYQEYINYFEQYPDIANINITDAGLQKAIDSTISSGRTSFFNARFATFRGRNDVTGEFTGTDGGSLDVADEDKYNAYFIAKYKAPEPPAGSPELSVDQKMDYAVSQHNASYPYNKIFRTVNDVTDEDASVVIKKLANTKTETLLNTKFNFLDTFANQAGFTALFVFQWLFFIASFSRIFTANSAINRKRAASAEPSLTVLPAQISQASDKPDASRAGDEYLSQVPEDQSFSGSGGEAGLQTSLPARRGGSRRRGDDRENQPSTVGPVLYGNDSLPPPPPQLLFQQGETLSSAGLPPQPSSLQRNPPRSLDEGSGSVDAEIFSDGVRNAAGQEVWPSVVSPWSRGGNGTKIRRELNELGQEEDRALHSQQPANSIFSLPPPPPLPQTVRRDDLLSPLLQEFPLAELVSSSAQFGQQGGVGMSEVGHSAGDSLIGAGGGLVFSQSQGGTISQGGAARSNLRRRGSNEASPEQAMGSWGGGGPAGEMLGGGAGAPPQRAWDNFAVSGQEEVWGRGAQAPHARSEIRPVIRREELTHPQGLLATTLSAASNHSGVPSSMPRKPPQRRATTLARAQGSVAPAPGSS